MRVGLELGGKDPAYVRSDVDVKWAAEEIVDGAIFNSGQSCCSLERVYVDQSVHDDFVKAVQDVLSGYKLGDPMDKATNIGPVVSKRAVEAINSHIKDALDKGATNATPENDSFKSPPAEGNYVAPTLLTNVNHDMLVMTEETFGPVIPVMKVVSDKEATKLMNDSQFGLTASIWTKDTEKGQELAEDVEAGTVFVNRCDFPSPVSTSPTDQRDGGVKTHFMDRTLRGWAGKIQVKGKLLANLALSSSSDLRAITSRIIQSRNTSGRKRKRAALSVASKRSVDSCATPIMVIW